MIQASSYSDFSIKVYLIQFYAIKHDFQLDCLIELIFLQQFLYRLLYIGFKFQVNQRLVNDYFKGFKLLDESCQIYLFGPSSNVWTISRAIKGITLRF